MQATRDRHKHRTIGSPLDLKQPHGCEQEGSTKAFEPRMNGSFLPLKSERLSHDMYTGREERSHMMAKQKHCEQPSAALEEAEAKIHNHHASCLSSSSRCTEPRTPLTNLRRTRFTRKSKPHERSSWCFEMTPPATLHSIFTPSKEFSLRKSQNPKICNPYAGYYY